MLISWQGTIKIKMGCRFVNDVRFSFSQSKSIMLFVLAGVFLGHVAISIATATSPTLEREVVIIGGGAAGVYAAMQLRAQGVSFAVVEKNLEFGGQTETYTVPGTNTTINYGVEAYTPLVDGSYTVTEDFFAIYDIPIFYVHESETDTALTRYFDFRTAKEISNFTYDTNLTAYAAQADKYPWLGYQTETPTPIPSDMLLTFSEFIEMYSLQSSVYNIFFNVEGLGDVLSLPAFYVLRELNVAHLLGLQPSSNGFIMTKKQNNQEVYLRAQADFGPDALVNSTLKSARRDGSGIRLLVNTPSGQTTISTSKLFVAMPPIASNMAPFDLDSIEAGLFNKFAWSGYYAALVNVTGLPTENGFQNAALDTQFNLPPLPAVYSMSATEVADIWLVRYGSQGSMSPDEVQVAILSSVSRIREAIVTNAASLAAVEILAFANHQPFNIHVSAEDINNGFYNNLAALQGHRRTWYSGATFFGASSSDIWNATQGVVAAMLAAE